MHQYYEAIAVKTLICKKLTEEEMEAIYRHVQFQYRCEDVQNHAINLHESGQIDEFQFLYACESAPVLAERYLYKYHDCNLAENDVFEAMILDYLEDHKEEIYKED